MTNLKGSITMDGGPGSGPHGAVKSGKMTPEEAQAKWKASK